jgi:hypothetical protein
VPFIWALNSFYFHKRQYFRLNSQNLFSPPPVYTFVSAKPLTCTERLENTYSLLYDRVLLLWTCVKSSKPRVLSYWGQRVTLVAGGDFQRVGKILKNFRHFYITFQSIYECNLLRSILSSPFASRL